MKRRLAVWLARRLLKVVRGRRGAAGRTRTQQGPTGVARELAETLLARVWPYVDTPGMRDRGSRFVSRMRSSAHGRA
jgi:hypothetical protein